MTVIEHGKYFKKDIINCPKCECKFTITEKDINKVQMSDYENIHRIVICPECKELISLD